MKQLHLFIILMAIPILSFSQKSNYNFLIGTYTSNTPSKGIYGLSVNASNFDVKTELLAELVDPNFMCFSPDKKLVYSLSGKGVNAGVSAFQFVNGKLILINTVSFNQQVNSCHISATQQHVVVANYGAGSVFVIGLNSNGGLTAVVQKIQHEGSSVDAKRQEKAHAHQALFSPDNKYVLVSDLGVDKVFVYAYDKLNATSPLTPVDAFSVKAGSGPRHLTFSSNGKRAFLVQELDGTVSVLGFKKGQLSLMSSSTLVRKSDIQTGAADIHLSADGQFLYATNRGTANDITCFKVSAKGELTFVQQVSVEGEAPRNFAISRDGKMVLVGNQRTHAVTIFRRNVKTGMLTFSELKVDLGSPVCILEYQIS